MRIALSCAHHDMRYLSSMSKWRAEMNILQFNPYSHYYLIHLLYFVNAFTMAGVSK